MLRRVFFVPLLTAGLLLPPIGAAAERYVPVNAATVVATLPASTVERAATLRRARHAAAVTSHDAETAGTLARRYLELGRSTGDPRFDGYAEKALAPWADAQEPPTPIALLRATLAQRRHEYAAALADLDRVVAARPSEAQAWLMRATILQVQGRYVPARAACSQLEGRVSVLVVATCRASSPTGKATVDQFVIDSLEAAVNAAADEPAEVRAWALGVVALSRRASGDDRAAEQALVRALAAVPDDPYLLTGAADLLLDQHRAREALALLPTDGGSSEIALRRARAEVALGREARDRDALTAEFAGLRQRGTIPHARSEAYFELYVELDAVRALPLAVRNFEQQRELIDARLLVDAAYLAHEPEAGISARRWLQSIGADAT
jgi:tetratricopeptide (TPR) repeat protein